jgi:orotate phosphoribosyltransferase
MTNERIIAEKLLQVKAVKLDTEKFYTWASGWKSPVYCDNRTVLSHPLERNFIKNEMCNIISQKFPSAEMLAGVATAGIAWGAMAADLLKLSYIYVRPKPKEHGMGNQIEGTYQAGQQVVVVEDLISTGKSSLQVVDVLREAGLKVMGMISIFNYGFAVADEAFRQKEVPYQSLTNYTALIELAIEKGIVSKENEKLLQQWRLNPAEWKAPLYPPNGGK